MITGFNPTDMYGADHIRRVLQTFPGVFTREFVLGEGKRQVSVETTKESHDYDRN